MPGRGTLFGSPWGSMSELNGLFPTGISNTEVVRFRNPSLHFMCRDFFLKIFFPCLEKQNQWNYCRARTHKKLSNSKIGSEVFILTRLLHLQLTTKPQSRKSTFMSYHTTRTPLFTHQWECCHFSGIRTIPLGRSDTVQSMW